VMFDIVELAERATRYDAAPATASQRTVIVVGVTEVARTWAGVAVAPSAGDTTVNAAIRAQAAPVTILFSMVSAPPKAGLQPALRRSR
jgi:hypothetical protein